MQHNLCVQNISIPVYTRCIRCDAMLYLYVYFSLSHPTCAIYQTYFINIIFIAWVKTTAESIEGTSNAIYRCYKHILCIRVGFLLLLGFFSYLCRIVPPRLHTRPRCIMFLRLFHRFSFPCFSSSAKGMRVFSVFLCVYLLYLPESPYPFVRMLQAKRAPHIVTHQRMWKFAHTHTHPQYLSERERERGGEEQPV